MTARGDRGPTGVLDRIDGSILKSTAEDYALASLRLELSTKGSGDGHLAIAAPTGDVIGAFAWQIAYPGASLLRSVLPGLILTGLGLLAFTLAMLAGARRATLAIEQSEGRFRDIAEASSDWIWETDADLRLTFVSERFAAAVAGGRNSLFGRRIDEILRPRDDVDVMTSDAIAIDEDPWRPVREHRPFRDLQVRYDGASGQRICRLAGRPVLGGDGRFRGYRGAATDVTAEIEANRVARHLALHDHLTGLPNRLLLKDRLEHAIASARRDGGFVAVLGLDLDQFKAVNDTLGHAAGDALLKAAAGRLLETVRGGDTVARIGGDEFTIIQIGMAQPHGAGALCARLHETFRSPSTSAAPSSSSKSASASRSRPWIRATRRVS